MITSATLLQKVLVAERESDVSINAEGANCFLNFLLMEQDECAVVCTAAPSAVFPPAMVRVAACAVSICFVNAAWVCFVSLLGEGAENLYSDSWQKRTSHQVHMLCNPACQLLRTFHLSSKISRNKGVQRVRLQLVFVADAAIERTGLAKGYQVIEVDRLISTRPCILSEVDLCV